MKDWTDEQCNKFLTLLMGGEWKDYSKQWNSNHDYLANPMPVIRWMEKEMPEVWNLYLVLRLSKWTCNKAWETIDQILDLRNLVTYLVEHPEWGEKECPHIKADKAAMEVLGKHLNLRPDVPDGRICQYCSGSGKITHPALEYARGLK